jgi:hypothetical protein
MEHLDTKTFFADLESLYEQLPEVACVGCGRCCVSPTCTLAEFLFMMNRCITTLPANDLEAFILAPPILNKVHEGNLDCIFLRQKQCAIHNTRSGACRLFGIPSINEMGIPDLVSCFNKITVKSGEFSESFIKSWLEKIVALNQKLYPFGSEPFHVYGFNIECWLDIYFDTTISDDFFNNIRDIMKQCFDLDDFSKPAKPEVGRGRSFPAALTRPRSVVSNKATSLQRASRPDFLFHRHIYAKNVDNSDIGTNNYIPKTGLKEKIDKIIILPFLLDSGDVPVIRETLISIRDDYPFTGTYFYREAQTLLDALPINR